MDRSKKSEASSKASPGVKRHRRTVQLPSSRHFESLAEAKQYIKEQHLWQFKFKSPSSAGTKLLYLCKYSAKCSARVTIFLPNDSHDVSLQCNDQHDHSPRQLQGISLQTKKAIADMWKDGIKKPRNILKSLEEDRSHKCVPSISQLNTYLLRLRQGDSIAKESNGKQKENQTRDAKSSQGGDLPTKRGRGRPRKVTDC